MVLDNDGHPTTTLKGILAALRIEERFGIPYCVEFQDYSRGGLFGRLSVTVARERLREGVGLVLTCLDNGDVVVTAIAGRKTIGLIDPNLVLKGDWKTVTFWVRSVVLDGFLRGK